MPVKNHINMLIRPNKNKNVIQVTQLSVLITHSQYPSPPSLILNFFPIMVKCFSEFS